MPAADTTEPLPAYRPKDRPPVLDVVCGVRFHLRKVRWRAVHESRRYYFCGATCRRRFEREPGAFVRSARS